MASFFCNIITNDEMMGEKSWKKQQWTSNCFWAPNYFLIKFTAAAPPPFTTSAKVTKSEKCHCVAGFDLYISAVWSCFWQEAIRICRILSFAKNCKSLCIIYTCAWGGVAIWVPIFTITAHKPGSFPYLHSLFWRCYSVCFFFIERKADFWRQFYRRLTVAF